MKLLRLLKKLFSSGIDPELPPPPVPPGHDRIHVFNSGETEEILNAYCYDAPDEIHPEPLTVDLPEAFIDTDYVALRHHPDTDVALRGLGLSKADLATIKAKANGPGWVILRERAFGGFPYRLHDTPVVDFVGSFLVERQ